LGGGERTLEWTIIPNTGQEIFLSDDSFALEAPTEKNFSGKFSAIVVSAA
jgi:hypothetical protein